MLLESGIADVLTSITEIEDGNSLILSLFLRLR